jgi:hypothetical protein
MNAITTTFGIDPFLTIDRAGLAQTTTRQYRRQIELYLASGGNLGNADQLAEYAQGLKSSPKAFLKSAIKLWTKEVERVAKASSTPDTVNAVLATLHRLDALNESIQVRGNVGKKAHIWLTQSEVKKLVNCCNDSLIGKLSLIRFGGQ